MSTFAMLVLTVLPAQAPPRPTPAPVPAVIPVPQIEAVWDSRGSEQTDTTGLFDHLSQVAVRINHPFDDLKDVKVELFLNGSPTPEAFIPVLVDSRGLVLKLNREFPRGYFSLTSRFSVGKQSSEISKPYNFRVRSPEAPEILGVFESDVKLPLIKIKLNDPVVVQEAKEIKLVLGGTLPGDEIRIYLLPPEGAAAQIGKDIIGEKPIREPIKIDLASLEGFKKGATYQIGLQLIRKGDASDFSTFAVKTPPPPPPPMPPKTNTE